jgi:hypothetical protein
MNNRAVIGITQDFVGPDGNFVVPGPGLELLTVQQNVRYQIFPEIGAGIEVFEKELTARENPLLSIENVIVTPHALAQTDESFTSMWSALIDQASRLINGEAPKGMVKPQVWTRDAFQKKRS